MYECVNCSAPLRFDIGTQELVCDSCGSHFDPVTYDNAGREVEARTDFDVRVYSCPQCAGEIMATNTTATTFCAYCGANVMLTERMSAQQKPEYIIPFRKNKNDCIKAYKRLLRRSLFAPGELRDPAHLNRFIGIYMPYWLFGAEVDDTVTMPGKTTKRIDSDHKQVTRYALRTQVQASYFGASRDASRGFADDFSEAIAPFDSNAVKPFSPAYFCGFFADIHDMPPENYKENATKMIASHLYRSVAGTGASRGYEVETEKLSDKTKIAHLKLKETNVQRAFFPVWFLSFRKKAGGGKDRVAYAVMNGQTGRIAADLPASEVKYLVSSLLLAIPLFFLFNFFLTLTPKIALALSGAGAIVTALLFWKEVNEIALRDLRFRRELAGYAKERESPEEKKAPADYRSLIYAMPCFIALAVALVVIFRDPVEDYWYYGAATAAYLCICVTLVVLIRKYNLLTTRPLPEFHLRTGGRAVPFVLLALALLLPARGLAAEEPVYRNEESGYAVYIDDAADLLTAQEEQALLEDMKGITAYGGAAFVTVEEHTGSAAAYAESSYRKYFGSRSGTVFLIDMHKRRVEIFSDGAVYKTITKGRANTITDNVYSYATSEEYYTCASTAFSQIHTLLEGGRIAEPMKITSNALLALITSAILNYLLLRRLHRLRTPSQKEQIASMQVSCQQKFDGAEVTGTGSMFAPTAAKIALRIAVEILANSGGGGGGGSSSGGGGGG
ncbi:MAG: TPM domain-containing protein, partial [Lachnospiraceae bacterium]|nr:TPM domain-containing protein [Lachnospiraceae bacterium]